MMINPQSAVPIMFQSPGGMMPMNLPQGMQFNYPMNNNINTMNQMPQPMQPFLGINQMNEEEDDEDEDEPDPILDDDSTDLNTVNPFILMENTALIIKKNLVERKWFLMRGDKILGNYNSEQLFYFLASQMQQGNKFEDMSINDHTTDLHFKPSILYDSLRKYVPKLKKRYLKNLMEQNKETMRKMQQQQQQMMQINQLNQMQMMKMKMNNQLNQMQMMKMNNHNTQENRNYNNKNNNHGYNNYNRYYNNNHGYNNMNYNHYHQGNNYYNNTYKKQYGK